MISMNCLWRGVVLFARTYLEAKNGSTRERIIGHARYSLGRSRNDCLLSSLDVELLERLIAGWLRRRRTLLPHLLAMRGQLSALCLGEYAKHL